VNFFSSTSDQNRKASLQREKRFVFSSPSLLCSSLLSSSLLLFLRFPSGESLSTVFRQRYEGDGEQERGSSSPRGTNELSTFFSFSTLANKPALTVESYISNENALQES